MTDYGKLLEMLDRAKLPHREGFRHGRFIIVVGDQSARFNIEFQFHPETKDLLDIETQV